MPKILIATVGYPRSGKTSWALSQYGIPIVNPDSIRLAIHGQPFIQEAEPFVWLIAHTMVKSLFNVGHQIVILDSTNITKYRRDEWKSKSWITLFKLIKTPIEECFKRASHEMIQVIERMSKVYEPLTDDEEELIEL